MTTPTDPYSRGNESDNERDDILEPLNENKDDFSPVFHEDPRDLDNDTHHDEAGDSGSDVFERDTHDHVDEHVNTEHVNDEHVSEEHDAQERGDVFAREHDDQTEVAAPAADKPAEIGDENHTVAGDATLDGDNPLESTRSWTPNFDDEIDEAAAPRRDERGFSSYLPSETDETPTEVRPAESVTRTSVFNRPVDDDATVVAPTSTPATQQTGETTSSPAYAAATPKPEPSPFVPDAPGGRGWSHVGVFFATLLLAPFAWYLLEDAGVRLGTLADSQWATGSMDAMAVLELVGGLICLGVLFFLASYSSFGAQFFGLILFLAGMFGVVAPAVAKDLLNHSAVQSFGDFNAFTGNVVYHLGNTLGTGRLAVYGFVVLFAGIVSHWARRHGQSRGQIEGERRVLIK